MEAATAFVIAAIIFAGTLIAAAMITTLTRIAKPASFRASPTTPSIQIPSPERLSFGKFRVVCWILVVVIYLTTAITMSFGIFLLALAPTTAATQPPLFFCAAGVLIAIVGFWSQRRLTRASKWYGVKFQTGDTTRSSQTEAAVLAKPLDGRAELADSSPAATRSNIASAKRLRRESV